MLALRRSIRVSPSSALGGVRNKIIVYFNQDAEEEEEEGIMQSFGYSQESEVSKLCIHVCVYVCLVVCVCIYVCMYVHMCYLCMYA